MANYTLPFTTSLIENAINLVTNSVAPAFSSSTAYSLGDTVVYNGLLYACKADTAAAEWSSDNWDPVKIFDPNGYLVLDGGGYSS